MNIRRVIVRISPDNYPMAAFVCSRWKGRYQHPDIVGSSPIFDPKEYSAEAQIAILEHFEREMNRLRP